MFKTRLFALMLAVLFVMTLFTSDAEAKRRNRVHRGKAPAAAATTDARYAAIIMNPVTGEVYHQKDADARRYPASLTKMMTLYLLFDALEQKKVSLNDKLPISELAARQPQTNLSLTPGETIPVETAIKALVVRSANDVAVVVGESLGGDVDSFARMMTNKARQLGMNGTVFKNPNGLPNSGQYTTARDMAKLGIALKRDFPRYYPYFRTLQFSHDGVTYYTHNRVMLRYAGTDGIKTGFIGASGFNLVTSVVRGGRPLVGTVMGGSSGRWRDDRMIQLLDQSYAVVASRGAVRGKMYPGNLPLAKNGSRKGAGVDASTLPTTEDSSELSNTVGMAEPAEAEDGGAQEVVDNSVAALPAATVPASREAVRTSTPAPEQPAPVPQAQAKPPAPATKAAISQAPIMAVPAKPASAPAPTRVIEVKSAPVATASAAAAPAQETMVAAAPSHAPAATPPAGDAVWGIQVGAFSSHALAEQSAKQAQQLAAKPLTGARLAVVDPASSGAPVYRARIENISQVQARKACELLIANNAPCFIYKAVP